MEEALQHVLKAHALHFGAVISWSGQVVARAGDFPAPSENLLLDALLGPSGSPKDTFDGLEGQILPQIWAQGDDFAFIDRPTEQFAVVVFGRGMNEAVGAYQMSKLVQQTIASEFGGHRA